MGFESVQVSQVVHHWRESRTLEETEIYAVYKYYMDKNTI